MHALTKGSASWLQQIIRQSENKRYSIASSLREEFQGRLTVRDIFLLVIGLAASEEAITEN